MTKLQNANCPPYKTLRVAGLSIIIMAVLAGISMSLFFSDGLQLRGNELLTYYSNHISDYRIAVASWTLILVCDLVATICFYEAYKRDRPLAGRIASQLRFVYSMFLLFGIIRLFSIWNLPPASGNAEMVEKAIYGFQSLWFIGLIIFGLHLLGLALLTPANNKLLVAIKWMLLLGGIGYIILHGGDYLVPGFANLKKLIEPVLVTPMILGELGLAVYMAISPRRLTNSLA